MFAIGMNLSGIFTKADMKRGKIAGPGRVFSDVDPSTGLSREFISVQLAGGQTLLNGMAFTIDANGVATLGTTGPSLLFGGRVGILRFASATSTATTVGTSFAWAQIYGKGLALVTASVTAVGGYLNMGADGRMIGVIAAASASSMCDGITAAATQAASGLLAVLLQYPKFQGYPA
jgi:hypothetical protein